MGSVVDGRQSVSDRRRDLTSIEGLMQGLDIWGDGRQRLEVTESCFALSHVSLCGKCQLLS